MHSARSQQIRDIPIAGAVTAIWRKGRWFCDGKKTFSEATAQVPAYARSTGRLRDALVAVVTSSGWAASEVAAAFSVSWWLVQTTLTADAALMSDVDTMVVRRIGTDEHRFHRVRYFQVSHRGVAPSRAGGCPRSSIWTPAGSSASSRVAATPG